MSTWSSSTVAKATLSSSRSELETATVKSLDQSFLTCLDAAPEPVVADQTDEVAEDGEGHGADDQHYQADHPCRPALRIVVGHSHLA